MKKSICIIILMAFIFMCLIPNSILAASPPAKLLRGDGTLVGDYASVQAAIDAVTVTAGDSFIVEVAEGTVTDPLNIIQQPNKSVVVRPEAGAEVIFTNTIFIDGNGNFNGPETLLIEGFIFDFSSGVIADCISFVVIPPNVGMSYPHNITINGCTFTGVFDTTVAVQSVPGGSRNIAITNCTATNMHSLAQLKAVSGYAFIQNCVVSNSAGGVNFYGTGNLIVDSCNFEVEGYAVRSGQGAGAIQNVGSVLINNSILNSNSTVGTVVLRGDSTSNINIVHSNLTNGGGSVIQNLNGASIDDYNITISESNLTGDITGINPITVYVIDDPNVVNGPICIINESNGNMLVTILVLSLFVLLAAIVVCLLCRPNSCGKKDDCKKDDSKKDDCKKGKGNKGKHKSFAK